MSDHNNSKSGLGMFLSQIGTIILAIISFISSINGFIKLYTEKDTDLINLISLTVGILLLFGICLYYAKLWQPMQKQQWASTYLHLNDEQAEARAKKVIFQQRIRRLAFAGLILIPILSISGVIAWYYGPKQPANRLIILVADFDGSRETDFKVTEEIISQLRNATNKYNDIQIRPLNKTITGKEGSEAAQVEGEKQKAAIVIWGWYSAPIDDLRINVHFEVLHPPKELPNVSSNINGVAQIVKLSELKRTEFQIRPVTEMNYLSLFTMGVIRYASGQWNEAVSYFSDAIDQKMHPSSILDKSAAFFYRGSTYLYQNNLDSALEDLSQAIKLNPSFAKAHGNRSIVYAAKGDFSNALADGNQMIKLKPDDFLAYNNRGVTYLKTGKYRQAIDDFTKTLKLLPLENQTSSDIQTNGYLVGNIRMGKVPLAQFVFSEITDYIVYNNRGITYLSMGDTNHALNDFNKAIELQPESDFGYFNRSAAYSSKREFDLALKDLNKLIELRPEFALSYMKRSSVYIAKGDYNHALNDCNHAIELNPDSDFFYRMRGEIYSFQDNHDQAIADFTQAIKLNPVALNYLSRANSLIEKGNFDSAFADFRETFKLDPNNPKAFNDRGWAYSQKGDFNLALADVNQAIKLKPDEASFYDTRGFAYAGKRNYKLAIDDYNHAIELKPTSDEAYYHRGTVYRAVGENQKAIADFKKTLELSKRTKRRQEAELQLRDLTL